MGFCQGSVQWHGCIMWMQAVGSEQRRLLCELRTVRFWHVLGHLIEQRPSFSLVFRKIRKIQVIMEAIYVAFETIEMKLELKYRIGKTALDDTQLGRIRCGIFTNRKTLGPGAT